MWASKYFGFKIFLFSDTWFLGKRKILVPTNSLWPALLSEKIVQALKPHLVCKQNPGKWLLSSKSTTERSLQPRRCNYVSLISPHLVCESLNDNCISEVLSLYFVQRLAFLTMKEYLRINHCKRSHYCLEQYEQKADNCALMSSV